MRQHPVERGLDAARQVVEHTLRARPQQHVQTHRKHTLLPPLECVAQPLGVFEGDLPLGVGEPAAAQIHQSRGLQLDQFVAEQLDDAGGLQRVDVEAHLDRMLELQDGHQPAG